jgi:hypothetical protein
MASLLTPSTEANLRQLQCVDPSLGFFRVTDRIRARRAGVSTLLLAGMIGVQSLESVLPEALLLANDRQRRGLQPLLDGVERRAFR